MNRKPKQLFVERQTYRKRRLRDGARFLPIVGIVLILVPLLWVRGEEGGIRTSSAIEYLFLVWAGLVLAGFVMALYLRDDTGLPGDDDEAGGDGLT